MYGLEYLVGQMGVVLGEGCDGTYGNGMIVDSKLLCLSSNNITARVSRKMKSYLRYPFGSA